MKAKKRFGADILAAIRKDKILGINSHIWILPQTPGRLEGYQDIVARVAALPHVTFAVCEA